MELDEKNLLYDWNTLGADVKPLKRRVEFDDETLRDGLQNPSVVDPHIEDKKRILHLMNDLGIQAADIGLPGAGPRAVDDVIALAREIVDFKLAIRPNCAARTHKADITPIIEISNKVGIPIEACTFLGSSPIRQYVEGWDIDRILRLTEDAVDYAVKGGLPVMMVTEDTTRAHPEDLQRIYATAINYGAKRICLADTVGHATPYGVKHLMRFVKEMLREIGAKDVKVDWHGHRDRVLPLRFPGVPPAHRAQLYDRGAGRLPDRNRCARGGHHQGREERARLAGRSGVLRCARQPGGPGAGDRNRTHERRVQRDLLAHQARDRADPRGDRKDFSDRQAIPPRVFG